MTRAPLPSADSLTRPQYNGWACVWCGKELWHGAVSAGRAEWTQGTGDIEVYACPDCAALRAPNLAPTTGDTP